MKTTFLLCFSSIALVLQCFGPNGNAGHFALGSSNDRPRRARQLPPSSSVAPDDEDSIQSDVERRLKRKFDKLRKLGIDIDVNGGNTQCQPYIAGKTMMTILAHSWPSRLSASSSRRF